MADHDPVPLISHDTLLGSSSRTCSLSFAAQGVEATSDPDADSESDTRHTDSDLDAGGSSVWDVDDKMAAA
jgi:hypothetical protein